MKSVSARRLWLAVIIAVSLFGGWLVWRVVQPTPSATTTTNSADALRSRYAALYQGAWRQDEGRGSVLVTATVFVPSLIESLGQQTERSGTEEQIWQATKDLAATDVPVVVTFDNVSGQLADATIEQSLKLAEEGGMQFTFKSWTPLIAPSRVVNTNVATVSQIGIAVFSASNDVSWTTLQPLRLIVTNIGDVPRREIVWAQPALLSQV
ncbi:MAG: hypothetical protein HY975_02020, partial [Candidatus Kerfeldbacteria bacterium]|nr:hypothetical protein [Candidatus Kerfeldbacteria bacterium]